jgi:hypothetical protein
VKGVVREVDWAAPLGWTTGICATRDGGSLGGRGSRLETSVVSVFRFVGRGNRSRT